MTSLKMLVISASSIFLLSACKNEKPNFDASGSFEAQEIIISSEATGTIKELKIEEGQILKAGDVIGYIDSSQLHLKKIQVEAQIKSLLSKKPNVTLQLATLFEQLRVAEIEKNRIAKLLKGDAATSKQLDDINANISIINKQIDAQKSTLEISTDGISKDAIQLYVQRELIIDQIEKCKIVNPANGTILSKYAEQYELALTGKALYKIADLNNIILRAYISGDQLAQIAINQNVRIITDDGKAGSKETSGTIIWISDKAEFTPKTIQTKNERANMVYAIKVKVKNDGLYKIGMYGEIKFN